MRQHMLDEQYLMSLWVPGQDLQTVVGGEEPAKNASKQSQRQRCNIKQMFACLLSFVGVNKTLRYK